MRNQWRRLLLIGSPATIFRPSSQLISRLQVHSTPLTRYFSSHFNSPVTPPLSFANIRNTRISNLRFFSSSSSESEVAVEHKESDQIAVMNDVFSNKLVDNEAYKVELESNSIVIDHDLVLSVLQSSTISADVARRLFSFVSEVDGRKLSSKCYNHMLGILGVNGFVKEFWDLVEVMNKKGYGVARGTVIRVSKTFESEGLSADLKKLEGLFSKGSTDNSIEMICSRVSKVFNKNVWGDDVEKQLMEVSYSSDLVGMVLQKLEFEPNKALIFFRWVEESGLFKHDELTYNVMSRVLGRKDYTDKLWRVLDEMRGAGYEITTETYIKIRNQLMKKKLIKDVVDLYEFAMNGANKPSVQDCTFLLRKIVVRDELDMDLFQRVVKSFRGSGNVFTSSNVRTVLKSLTSFGECNKILEAMGHGGLVLSDDLQSKVAFRLSSEGENNEASEFVDTIEASGGGPNYQTWVSLVEGYYVAGQLDKASDCVRKMIEKEGPSSAGYPFELLVTAYCSKNRAMDAFELLSVLVKEKDLKPKHTTYKALTKKLLVQGHFKEALDLLCLMKAQGFPPFLDPFVEYISKSGTTDDATLLLKSMSVKRFPSKAVYLRVFEAYFNAGKHDEAHNLLSRCPQFIRNHADILNFFYLKRAAKDAVAENAAVA